MASLEGSASDVRLLWGSLVVTLRVGYRSRS